MLKYSIPPHTHIYIYKKELKSISDGKPGLKGLFIGPSLGGSFCWWLRLKHRYKKDFYKMPTVLGHQTQSPIHH